MLNFGLSAADRKLFDAGLADDHKIRIRLDILDLDHRVVGTGTGLVISGQVDWTANPDYDTPQRTCTLNVYNPGDVLNLGTMNGPGSAAFYADRMVQVWYGVWSQQLPRWVDVPVFTGPITKVEPSDSDTVTINADDKSRLMMSPSQTSARYPRGSLISANLVDLLHKHGERFLEVPSSSRKLVKDYQCTTQLTGWREVWSLCGTWGGGDPTYDARGTFRLRSKSTAPVLTVRRGPGGLLLTQPRMTFDQSKIVNRVVVTGATPSGAKAPVVATANAAATHPCSAINLGRGGVPRVLLLEVQDDQITTKAAAQARANQELSAALDVPGDASLEMIPHPGLEPGDTVRIDAGHWSYDWRISTGTLPLTADGHMTLGKTYTVRNMLRPRNMPRKGNARPRTATKPAARHAAPTHKTTTRKR